MGSVMLRRSICIQDTGRCASRGQVRWLTHPYKSARGTNTKPWMEDTKSRRWQKNTIMTLAKVEILEQDTVQKQGRVASRFLLKPSSFRPQRVTVKEQKGKARQCVCSRSGPSTEVAHCFSVLSRTVALVIKHGLTCKVHALPLTRTICPFWTFTLSESLAKLSMRAPAHSNSTF